MWSAVKAEDRNPFWGSSNEQWQRYVYTKRGEKKMTERAKAFELTRFVVWKKRGSSHRDVVDIDMFGTGKDILLEDRRPLYPGRNARGRWCTIRTRGHETTTLRD
jgi:hypothetical protein